MESLCWCSSGKKIPEGPTKLAKKRLATKSCYPNALAGAKSVALREQKKILRNEARSAEQTLDDNWVFLKNKEVISSSSVVDAETITHLACHLKPRQKTCIPRFNHTSPKTFQYRRRQNKAVSETPSNSCKFAPPTPNARNTERWECVFFTSPCRLFDIHQCREKRRLARRKT